MGIKGLTKLLSDECPECIKESEMESLTGRKVAVDASMAIYQFLIAVRSGSEGNAAVMLTNEAGEVTSHIQGMFNRTIRMLSAGVKPVFVFDGKPPVMKSGELAKRTEKREKASEDLKEAEEAGNVEDVERFSKRLVRATKQHTQDCKTLLTLMGVPIIDAPCEAEAQCAALAKADKVYGTATEDMDALTFHTPKLLRRMTFSAAQKQLVMEVDLQKVLRGLDLTFLQFVDLCILCGCDYCGSIRGIGPKTALNLVKKYQTIENILEHLDKKKYEVPKDWLPPKPQASDGKENEDRSVEEKEGGGGIEEGKSEPVEEKSAPKEEEFVPAYAEARRLFLEPEVADLEGVELKWVDPDEAGLMAFLVDKLGFNPERVTSGIKKLKEARGKSSQRRMDSFFKAMPTSTSSTKRKELDTKKPAGPAKKQAGGKGGGKPRR